MRVSDSNSGLKMSKRCQRNLRSKCYSTRNDHKQTPTQKKGRGRDPADHGDVGQGKGMQMGGKAGEAFQELSLAQHWLGKLLVS